MSESPSGSRESPRTAIIAEVRLRRTGNINYTVEARDLSEGGCKVEFVERPRRDEKVWVKFEGLESLEATGRWTRDFCAGLEFSRPNNTRVLELLLRRL